jgi:hypothetical protein
VSSDVIYISQLNRVVMSFLFLIPLTVISLFESTFGREKNAWMHNWLRGDDEGGADYPEVRDPDVDEGGKKIANVSFDELKSMFPDVTQVCSFTLVYFNCGSSFLRISLPRQLS